MEAEFTICRHECYRIPLFNLRIRNDRSKCKVVGVAVTRISLSLFSPEVLTYSLIDVMVVGVLSFSEN